MESKSKFINTGRFTPALTFLKSNPDVKLHADCTDVIMYTEGHYIQALKTGEYLINKDGAEHNLYWGFQKLSDAENALWEEISTKKFDE